MAIQRHGHGQLLFCVFVLELAVLQATGIKIITIFNIN